MYYSFITKRVIIEQKLSEYLLIPLRQLTAEQIDEAQTQYNN